MEDVVNVKDSAKLQLYYDKQSLDLEDMNFIDTIDLKNLLLKSEFDTIKAEVERYNELKEKVSKGEGDVILMSDEMKNLSTRVLAETGKDINQIELSSLETVTKIEDILSRSGIHSQNDLQVRPIDDEYFNGSAYVKCTLCDRYGWGIQQGTRLAISQSGVILTVKSGLYVK